MKLLLNYKEHETIDLYENETKHIFFLKYQTNKLHCFISNKLENC